MTHISHENEKIYIFSPYITKNGIKIYRKDGKKWRFLGDRRK